MKFPVQSAYMETVSAFIGERMGLHFPRERWSDLASRLEQAAVELGFEDDNVCIRAILTGTLTVSQTETLVSYLTVGETYFFRDPATFEILEREILPALLRARAETSRTIRLWSAGCCTGEEAYSLAITCYRAIPHLRSWNITILATDLNPKFLHKAEVGVYSQWSFRGTPDWVRGQFFTQASDREFKIIPAIKKLICFGYLNLAVDPYPSLQNNTNLMDVIFCRNVLMYFTPKHQRNVVAAFYRCLVGGGVLIVNAAEASTTLFSMFTAKHYNGTILYYKNVQVPSKEIWSSFLVPDITDVEPPCETELSFQPESSALVETVEPDSSEADEISVTPPSPLSLAHRYANEGQLDEALAWCQRAIEEECTNATAYFLCGMIQQELGKVELAITALEKVLYLDQDFILAHYALGGLYKHIGKHKASLRHFNIVLRLLSRRTPDEVMPESDGMTCGRLMESVRAMMGV